MERIEDTVAKWLDKSLAQDVRLGAAETLTASPNRLVLDPIYQVLNDDEEPLAVSQAAGRALAQLEGLGFTKVEEFDLRDSSEAGYEAYEAEYSRLAGLRDNDG